MRRRVILEIDSTEIEYEMLLIRVTRQLLRGQTRGEVFCGSGHCFFRVETDHTQAPPEQEC